MIFVKIVAVLLVLVVPVYVNAQPLDQLPHEKYIPDTQLQQLLTHSIRWLKLKATETNNSVLQEYTQQLLQVRQRPCTHCIDYFEAVALVRGMGKAVRALLEQDCHDIIYPAIRRSFVAAVWLMQRSRLFVWARSRLEQNAVDTMFRLYVHHVKRAQGRTISFHHISKCGGTTMCQLAATNKCSNPHLSIEKNCVLDDRLDSPIWMVSHIVNATGAFLNTVSGVLDVKPSSPINEAHYNRLGYSTEPPLPMWLMYACPYQLTGKPYTCQARMSDVKNSGTTFLSVERTLSPLGGRSIADMLHPTPQHSRVQVCPNFINAVTLRQPVPHAISLLAEAKFRYVRQLQQQQITTWEPPAWNLTWWETFGPALVGSYASRTLIGRESFCRSAANMGTADLQQAVAALLGFDMVMTLDRTKDIDLVVTTMLGWPAKTFSSQPAKRVRSAAWKGPMAAGLPVRRLLGDMPFGDDFSGTDAVASFGHQHSLAAAVEQLQTPFTNEHKQLANSGGSARNSSSSSSGGVPASSFSVSSKAGTVSSSPSSRGASSGERSTAVQEEFASVDDQLAEEDFEYDKDADEAMDDFDRAAAQYHMGFDTLVDEPVVELPAEVIEAQAAVALVRTSVLDRQSQLLGYANVSAAVAARAPVWEPRIEMLQAKSKHGAHQLMVVVNGTQELWHAFPRHSFAFTAADMQRLELLTHIDAQLFEMADLLLDLDTAWLRAIMQHTLYRQQLQSIVQTHTACGFAGIIPQSERVQRLLQF